MSTPQTPERPAVVARVCPPAPLKPRAKARVIGGDEPDSPRLVVVKSVALDSFTAALSQPLRVELPAKTQ